MAQVGSQNEPLHERALFGFDGSAWHRLAMLWGYTDVWIESVTELNAAVGTNILTATAVPSGYVYVLRAIHSRNTNTAVRQYHYATINGVNVFIKDQAAVGAGIYLPTLCDLVLNAGDTVSARFDACVLNDDLNLTVSGYKMKVND